MPTDYEKDKQAKLEAQKAMQQKHNIIQTEENKEEIIVPKTFKQKWANYWYHYKFHTFATVFILIFVASLFYNVIFPPKFDATLILVSEQSFEGSEPVIKENIVSILPDYDKNGEKELQAITIMLDVSGQFTQNAETLEANRARLLGAISKKETFLYIVDKACYQVMIDMGVEFKDLNEIGSSDRIQGDKYSLKNSKINAELGLNSLLDDMYLCLVDFDLFDEKVQRKQKVAKRYEHDKDFLQIMINLDS